MRKRQRKKNEKKKDFELYEEYLRRTTEITREMWDKIYTGIADFMYPPLETATGEDLKKYLRIFGVNEAGAEHRKKYLSKILDKQ